MTHGSSQPDPEAAIALLRRTLERAITPEAMQWLDAEAEGLHSGRDERRIAVALGLAARKVGRTGLRLEASEIAAAASLRAGWQPQAWSVDDAARVLLLLATYQGDDRAFAARIDRLCATAEVTEHAAILKGFAVFPAPELLLEPAREGVRSAVQPVVEAIACRNPYPRQHFDEAAWNQMVVKCVFMGAPFRAIDGLMERRNPELIRMLADLADERRAAGRPMPDEVLRYIEQSG